MTVEKFNSEPQYKKTAADIALEKRISNEAEKQRKASSDEIIVSSAESQELQKQGYNVVAMFYIGREFKHKLKKPKEIKK